MKWAVWISLAVCVGLSVCYWLQPDSLAGITFWPAWAWVPLGFALALLGWRKRARWALLASLAPWLIFVLVFREEPVSLLRGLLSVPPREGRMIRVVSLNCAGGNPNAAREVLRYDPDIILLQESPSVRDVRALGRAAFSKDAGVLCGLDCSIVARGKVDPYLMSSCRMECVGARVKLKRGPDIDVVSIRLTPPVLRIDLWSPDYWRGQAANRRVRRKQLKSVMDELNRVAKGRPLVIGGDFNTAAGDGALREMKPRLRDSFCEAGRGWGNTGINEIPVQRVDQVWVSREVTPVNVTASRTQHSDHRMVVCDLAVQ